MVWVSLAMSQCLSWRSRLWAMGLSFPWERESRLERKCLIHSSGAEHSGSFWNPLEADKEAGVEAGGEFL